MAIERRRWLLIGNSRWHWAESLEGEASGTSPSVGLVLRHWHQPSPGVGDHGPLTSGPLTTDLVAWVAVGAVDPAWNLPEPLRFGLEQIPLAGIPLAGDRPGPGGLGAWRREQALDPGASVLVADAGTALSLTRVDGGGQFRGGRLMAGFGLQLRALAAGTAALPAVAIEALAPEPSELGAEPWPVATAAAMVSGVGRGLAAALLAACQELSAAGEPTALWLTGGDGPTLLPWLASSSLPVRHDPDLVLEALVALSSGPGPRGSHRPGFPP
ncbi:type III pantothenate kinase [Cyanobium sp. ATX-6F1]|uniref:type III pantothenate kinase n=1 Tax=Cyanobium sp. ATX-6F1 TaxID=3137388 RepID=UPI0039BE9031